MQDKEIIEKWLAGLSNGVKIDFGHESVEMI